MSRRLTYLILAAGAIAAAFLGWNAWRNAQTLTPAEVLKRLPTADSVVLALDFSQLRHSGIFDDLAGAKVLEEPDYQSFVRDTGFDYKRDLDEAFVAFSPAGNFFIVRGRFDWQKLAAYAKQSGGGCYNELCHMQGSTPERRISFLPLAKDLMGLAVGSDDLAASRLAHAGAQRPIAVPSQPVWLSIPNSALGRSANNLPAATRILASAMSGAQEIMLTLGAQGPNFAARLEAQCKNAQDAANLAGQLQALTSLLKGVIERDRKKPDANDLSGVITAGIFHQSDHTVYGEWTLQKSFVDRLTHGM